MNALPTVDFRRFESDFDGFAQAMGASYLRCGFAVVSHHGLPQALIDGTLAGFQQFFARDAATKRQWHVPGQGGARGRDAAVVAAAHCAQAHHPTAGRVVPVVVAAAVARRAARL